MWFSLFLLLALVPVRGTVRDAVTRAPLAGVVVQVAGRTAGTATDADGRFSLEAHVPARLRFTRVGYVALELAVTDSVLDVFLVPAVRSLEGVTVTALRAEGGGNEAPITQRIVSRDELERRYSGQEIPLLLTNLTPSLTSYSDGGAFSNYTYLRLRGIDQSRINITLDGVPLNDAEDQGVFFSNFPDFANSVQSVQVQRGVGTSSQGTAAYAGSVNFESVALAGSTRRGEVQLSRGAFDTNRGSAEWQSGLLSSGLAFYGRLSTQQTDGFRYHSGNRSAGGFGSAGYFGARTSVKVTALTGVSRNQMAYLASPVEEIRRDPRHNALTPEERDRFTQSMVSATATRLVASSASVTATAYTLGAGGDYDVLIGDALWNFNLTSRATGGFATWNATRGTVTASAGVHGSRYARDHFLLVRPDVATEQYRNTGEKDEASAFAKASWERGALVLFGDAQLRRAWYRYLPDAGAGIGRRSIAWTFVNPKVGATYRLRPTLSLYATVGSNGREPTRNDMLAGFDNLDTTNADFVGTFSRVRPERVQDVEAGLTYRARALDLGANVYSMDFRHEITPIGELSYIGLPLRKNVRASHRRGVEVDATYRGWSRVLVAGSVAWSRNRIAEYVDDATGERFRDVPPLLTPTFLANHSAELQVARGLSLGADGRYLSRSFLANTGDRRFVTPPAYLLDGALTWRVGSHAILAQVRNVLDRELFTGGYTDGATSYYYLQARRNLIVTVRAGF